MAFNGIFWNGIFGFISRSQIGYFQAHVYSGAQLKSYYSPRFFELKDTMLRWPYLVLFGFFLFTVTTLYVATLPLNLQTLQYLSYLAIATYGVGILGMAIAVTKVGEFGKLIGVLMVGIATGGVAILAIFPRLSIHLNLPFAF